MKLVAPQVGWALVQQHLYWTNDDGRNWNDITPPGNPTQRINGVFFLDRSHGWAVLSEKAPADDGGFSLSFASTSDGGQSWRGSPIGKTAFPALRNYAGGGSIFFLDPQRGWLMLRLASSSNFSFGLLLATVDAGETWSERRSSPAADPVYFITPEDGWIAGGPAGDQLWSTHDGGRSWKQQSVPPISACTKCKVEYDLPKFENAREGVLPVSILDPGHSLLGTYVTRNGGESWQAGEVYEEPQAAVHGVAACVVGSHVLRAVALRDKEVRIRAAEKITSASLPTELWPVGSIVRADFVDDSSGWVLYSAGRCANFKEDCSQQIELLSTDDGGKTFRVVTPLTSPMLPQAQSDPSGGKRSGSDTPLFHSEWGPQTNGMLIGGSDANPFSILIQASDPSGTVISQNQGFDMSCVTTASNMQTWWQSSPYFDTGVYLGGCNVTCAPETGQNYCHATQPFVPGNKTVNVNLDATWVSNVSAQGWGIMPLWVGPQAPCADCSLGDASLCFWVINSPSAFVDGEAEADTAMGIANGLGITNSVIYYDMEPYTPPAGDHTCSSAVINFMEGWVTELHNKGFATAGAYDLDRQSNVSDFISVVPLPDAAWLTYLDGSTYQNASVDDLMYLNGSWNNHQTIHQYCFGASCAGTWGPLTLTIDGDVQDGPVVPGQYLPAPTLTYPGNMATGVSVMPNFTWTQVNGAASYRIMIATNPSALAVGPDASACSECVLNDTAPGPPYTPGSGILQANVPYYWEVHARGQLVGLWSGQSSFTTGSSTSTLSVALNASPNSGIAPLSTILTATVSGTATGTINYTFWYNCSDPGTSVSEEMTICGTIPTPTAGTCAYNSIGYKCDGVTANPETISYAYSSAGSYTAKVIAERGSALPSESRTSISVTSPTISGQVTMNGSGLGGVTMTLSGSSTGSATTTGSGNYSFTVNAGGSYTVTPSLTNYTFSPPSATFSNLSGNQTANFTANLVTYTISGQVTLNGAGLSGVTVTLSGGANNTATTGSSGNYSFSNLTSGLNYVVTPSLSGYTFSPPSQGFTGLNVNQSGINFAATAVTTSYTISGQVTLNGAGLSGVTVTLSGGANNTATTSSSGNYSFSNLTGGLNYVVTPSLSGYTFSPPSQGFTGLNVNQSGINFAATAVTTSYTISGQVTLNGSSLSGVTMQLSGSASNSTTTNGSGNYSFGNLAAGGNYSVTPFLSGYSFSPTSLTFNNLGGNQPSANFTASTLPTTGPVETFSSFTGINGTAGSPTGIHSLEVDSAGNVYVLFPPSSGGLAVVKSPDGGQTFGTPVAIPNSGSVGDFTVDSANTLHAVWSDSTETDVYYSNSANGGTSFSSPISIRTGNTYNGYKTINALNPLVASDGAGNVYVVYASNTETSGGTFVGYNLWVSQSTNGGSSFNPEYLLQSPTSTQKSPTRIYVASGKIYVVYADQTNNDIYFTQGNTTAGFSAPSRMNQTASKTLYGGSDIAIDPNGTTIYGAYADTSIDPDGDIYFSESINSGATWGSYVRVNDNTYLAKYDPMMRRDAGGTLHLVWTDQRNNGMYQTYYAASTNGGATFSANINVSAGQTSNPFEHPRLAVDNPRSILYVSSGKYDTSNNNLGIFLSNGSFSVADLSVLQSASPNPVSPGSPLTYTITVDNAGPASAPGVTLSGSTPTGTTFASVGTTQGFCTPPSVGGTGPVSCALGTLASGASAGVTMIVNVAASAGPTLSNTVTVTSNVFDPDPANNSSTVTTSVTPNNPVAGASPTSLTFGSQNMGTTSGSQPVTLSNTGTAALTITNIAASANFGQTNYCGGSVPASGSCTINVTFSPTATGALTGALTITDNSNGVTGSTQTVSLSGTGTAPSVSLSARGLSFGSQALSTTSAAQTETVTNTGTGDLTISTVTLGGTNASDFAKSADTCTGATVTPNGTCTVSVRFTPSATGSRSASLNFTDNNNGVAGSTQMVTLRGTGIVPVVHWPGPILLPPRPPSHPVPLQPPL
jgi:hypothetical protein